MKCREEIIASGASLVPRSCPTCKFGPCRLNKEDYMTYNYGVIVKDFYQVEDDYTPGIYTPVYYQTILTFTTKEELIEWIERNNTLLSKQNVVKCIKFTELTVKHEITLEDAKV
jgi:hypothetical protein